MTNYPKLLRALADVIEANDLIAANVVTETLIQVHAHGEDAPRQLAAWRRALGGTWTKKGYEDFITLDGTAASLPGSPKVNLFIDKDRCTRKVVGTETVTVPAVEAEPERTETREIVEWDCEPVLAGVAS